MPGTVLISTGDSRVSKTNDHCPYGTKRREWEEYRNQKRHAPNKQRKPNISLKSGLNSL